MTKHIFRFNPKNGVIPVLGFMTFIFSADILSPETINFYCKNGYMYEKYVCAMATEEPLRENYLASYRYNAQVMAASGTASVSPSASPSPSPSPEIPSL